MINESSKNSKQHSKFNILTSKNKETAKLESIISQTNSATSIYKKNFERNLKNANEEIQRLRMEVKQKSNAYQNL